jgi:HK97 family phage prohead protease
MNAKVKLFSGVMDLGRTEGRFKALICSYGQPDKSGDVVVAGAFDACLKRRRANNERIPVGFNHDINNPEDVIGEVSPYDTQSTAKGLVVSGEFFIDEPRAAKMHALLKRGTISQWSFGCYVKDARPRPGGKGLELRELDLFEVSPVLIAKGEETQTIMVASADRRSSSTLTAKELLAPYRARLDVMQHRIARTRAQAG